ncbi:uncharacterized protein LOC111862032 [Cryptotermes secundus]|uniref:uncharacterized protein LOC111862032 n=1 Tax=Cryptotermes secundus TaxID=105785 RepID=UPI000CD7BEE8|nr:uncharacterized protein LOC111862032 [Cryptotermes secundus]XP_023702856.1 uncharacterized protein LOC111862032 [Cryptotermes secundus]
MGWSPVQQDFHCCFCKCSLKNATVTLGCIEMIASIVQLAWFTLCLVEFDDIDYYCWFGERHLSWLLVGHRDLVDVIDININIALVSQAAVLAICCFLLLFGVYIEKPVFMIPYLMICQLGIFVLVLGTIAIGVNKLLVDLVSGLIIILGGFALMVIALYLCLIKYSYYRKLSEKPRRSMAHIRVRRRPENTAV